MSAPDAVEVLRALTEAYGCSGFSLGVERTEDGFQWSVEELSDGEIVATGTSAHDALAGAAEKRARWMDECAANDDDGCDPDPESEFRGGARRHAARLRALAAGLRATEPDGR